MFLSMNSTPWERPSTKNLNRVLRKWNDFDRYDRIREFELQAKQGDQWRTFHSGTTIGEDFSVEFAPVTAQHVRLRVLDTTTNPLVGEFQLFRARKRP